MMDLHPAISDKRLCNAVERQLFTPDNPGFCNCCGKTAENCEPDTPNQKCQFCGALAVYGAEDLFLMAVA